MKAVVQRVSRAEVRVDQKIKGKIGQGLLIYLGIEKGDLTEDYQWLINKILNLRIFPNAQGKFDQSVSDISGSILLISQFTLLGDCHKGRRPGFDRAEEPEKAQLLYNQVVAYARTFNLNVEQGEFGALMEVDYINHGPVTFILDSPKP